MLVKLCGLRQLQHLAAAKTAGADAIGLNLTAQSQRRVDVSVARALAENAGALLVVWVIDATPPRELAALLDDFPHSLLQRSDAAWPWPENLAAKRRIEVVRLTEETPAPNAHFVISDSAASLGGSGKKADWSLTAKLARKHPRVLLAGGLTPENVAEAVARVRPFGVDVASGIERNGAPDAERMAAFVARSRGVR